jgi:hypothetical protein
MGSSMLEAEHAIDASEVPRSVTTKGSSCRAALGRFLRVALPAAQDIAAQGVTGGMPARPLKQLAGFDQRFKIIGGVVCKIHCGRVELVQLLHVPWLENLRLQPASEFRTLFSLLLHACQHVEDSLHMLVRTR